jgi:hypothetical protein
VADPWTRTQRDYAALHKAQLSISVRCRKQRDDAETMRAGALKMRTAAAASLARSRRRQGF